MSDLNVERVEELLARLERLLDGKSWIMLEPPYPLLVFTVEELALARNVHGVAQRSRPMIGGKYHTPESLTAVLKKLEQIDV